MRFEYWYCHLVILSVTFRRVSRIGPTKWCCTIVTMWITMWIQNLLYIFFSNPILSIPLSRNLLSTHLFKFHSDIKVWDCAGCNISTLICHRDLEHHVYLHHFTGNFHCLAKACTYEAYTRGMVLEHYQKKHGSPLKVEMEKPQLKYLYECPFGGCGKIYQQEYSLKRHIRYSHQNKTAYQPNSIVSNKNAQLIL